MEAEPKTEQVDDEEEYVLLDLGIDCGLNDIKANIPYVLSGLDTLNPILTINGKKLIGEYQETLGTCLVFSENDGAPSSQTPSKQVKPIAGLHKILKFRLATEDEIQITADRVDICKS